ncbi:hypothetical protein [Parvibaculum sp.]|uniref:hypothetical protein n=1 Tax=Parvibaculum sp. TaxID=2024848 RepID=UPI0025E22699|nr:hypothetical protein [Parvibaculum sp.]|tara:strand:+ start:43205 stop:43441 length:237 start_codon:yes stop_codon:yes gene_type:complete
MDLLAREPQFAADGEVLDFPAAGQTPHGAHIDREKSGDLFWRHERAFREPVDGRLLRHRPGYGLVVKNQSRNQKFFVG